MTIRHITSDDSLEELTELLHRAYAPLAALGLRFFATHQTVEQTRSRCDAGLCFLGEMNGEIVATGTLYRHSQEDSPDWYRREEVAHFGQFAVDPSQQRKGLGTFLLRHLEREAARLGALELALDTAESAHHLIAYYEREGYRHVGTTQWDVTNYRSVVMSKRVGEG